MESQNLVDVMYGSPEPHYMIPKKANFLAPLMRGDTVIPGALDYSRLCTSRHPELTARRAVTPAAQRGSLISLELLDRLKKREDP